MRPTEITSVLEQILDHGNHVPVFIWGPPGSGKSSIVKQVTERNAIGFKDVRMTLLDPTDLRGIPIPFEGKAMWLAPGFLPDEKRDGEQGVLFLDELNAAPPLVQASGYQLVLDRAIGEYKLPDGWTIVGAGNRQGDRAVIHRMPSPLANRFIHLDFDVHLDDWTDWAITHRIQSEVIGFIRFRSALLDAFDPKRDERAFPTPRSWEYVSRLLTIGRGIRNIMSSVVAGAVGDGAAAEFMSYLDVYQRLPDLGRILEGRSSEVPEEKDIRYATITALATRAEGKHIENLLKYSTQYPAEFAVLLVKLLMVEHKEGLIQSQTYRTQWIRKFKGVIL